jgi:hypothetical protein
MGPFPDAYRGSPRTVQRHISLANRSAGWTRNSERDAEFRARLRRYEERMHPRYSLSFNGSRLSLQENDAPIVSWPAVSGRPGTQGPEYQSYVDHGPLPQGSYRAKVSDLQRLEDTNAWEQTKGIFGGGPWPGGSRSWGKYRFWLAPDEKNRIFGRDNFSIHGGSVPGSAGCIDLTSEMDDFVDLMQALGQDEMDVRVDYGWQGSPNHRHR